ncbi:MAG: ABC transporter permease [Acidimicrobiia bacterium]
MSPQALAPLVVVAGLAGLAVAGMAWRRPLLRRLAIRAAGRRPTETALVVLGSLLGTAIITGSFIVGDTLDASIRASAWTQLGPVDEVVTAFGTQSLPVLEELLADLPDQAEVDGVLFGLRASATVAARLDQEEPAAQPNVTLLELAFDRARDFGGDRSATGLGDTPTPEAHALAISRDLAEELQVEVGDRVTLFAYGSEQELVVSAVLPRVGVAGFSTAQSSQSYNAFPAPGTVAGLLARAPADLPAAPPVALGLVSNRGGVIEGADHTEAVVRLIEERIAAVEGVEVDETKERLLEVAGEVGDTFSTLFLSIGAFAVIAGILLLVNIFVMLAEERKRELGMMRAVGMRRAQMVRAFTIEGAMYGLVASLAGALIGIGVGAAVVRVAGGIFGRAGDFSLELRTTVTLASLAGGFLVGFLISLATVVGTSLRISRVNIIRAIRDLPEPPSLRPRLRTLLLGLAATVAGLAWLVLALAVEDPYGALAAPGLLGVGIGLVAGRLLPRRLVVTAVGLALVGWGVFADSVVPQVFQSADTPVFVVQGLLLTFAAVAVASQNQELVGRLAGEARRLWVRIGLAYPVARRFRTSMTLGMFALVIFTLTTISIFSNIFGRQVAGLTADEAGGYQILVRSSPTSPLPVELLGQAEGVEHAAALRYAAFSVEFRPEGREEFDFWALSGFDRSFLEGGPPELGEWLPEYPDQESVWQAVLGDPALMIVDAFFLQTGGGPATEQTEVGDTVAVRDPLTGVEVERRVVAQSIGGFAFSGAFASAESVEAVLGERAVPNRAYVAVSPGAGADEVAAGLEADYLRFGVRADTFRSIVADNQQANLQFFRLMQGYLALGLLVGIAGLAVIMVRALRERRRQIGVLRSLGFQPEHVRRSFLLESGFVAAQGILIGVVLAVITAYQLVANAEIFGNIEVDFVIPWVELAILLGLTFLASVAATGWPAQQASRVRPAVALRVED